MKKILFFFLLFSFSSLSFSNSDLCFEFDNLNGGIIKNNGKIKKSSMNNKVFKFILKGNGEIINDTEFGSKVKYILVNSGSIMGIYNENGNRSIETWTLDKNNSKVYLNKTQIWNNEELSNTTFYIGRMKECALIKTNN